MGRAGLEEIELRLGDLFGELGSALADMFVRLDAGDDGELRREHVFETEKGPVRAHAGIRLHVGGVEPGHRKNCDPQPVNCAAASLEEAVPAPLCSPAKAAVRAIATEIIHDGVLWKLTADLPGVAPENLDLSVEDSMLVVAAEARGCRYADRIPLPPGTLRFDPAVVLQNGSLEVEAPSRTGSAP